jgi:hypothetical protein
MKYFKIKNLTNTFNKRDVRANTVLNITYVDSMVKKIRVIYPNETLFLELSALPLSIHKMRINGLIAVSEISKDEFLMEQKKSTQKKTNTKVEKKVEKKEVKKNTKSTGRKYTKKKDDDENQVDVVTDDVDENTNE